MVTVYHYLPTPIIKKNFSILSVKLMAPHCHEECPTIVIWISLFFHKIFPVLCYRQYIEAVQLDRYYFSRKQFGKPWSELRLNIITNKPATDLCLTCQQLKNFKISFPSPRMRERNIFNHLKHTCPH